MTAGMGVGGQIGGELTDFVFILNTKSAVETFAQAGSITLGGNVSLAAGPIGRNAEAAGSASLKSVAAVFSYAKTKGLFAGVSLEGSVLIERRDANRTFYGQSCNARQILSGRMEPPPACDQLFRVLESRAFQGARYEDDYDDFYSDIPDEFSDTTSEYSHHRGNRRDGDFEEYDGYSPSSRNRSRSNTAASWEDDVYDRRQPSSSSNRRRRRNNHRESYDDTDDITRHLQRAQFHSTYSDNPGRPAAPKPDYYGNEERSGGTRSRRNTNSRRDDDDLYNDRTREREREYMRRKEAESNNQDKAVALYTFEGEEGGDLSFRKGDVITIVKKSESKDDWWTGRIGPNQGIFPANYVDLV